MTQFDQVEILFNQYLNLSKEIDALIQNEDYNEAANKVESMNKLVKKVYLAKKTVDLNDEQKQKFNLMQQQIQDAQNKQIELLTELHKQVGAELKNTNEKVKINNAYDNLPKKKSGSLVDVVE